MKKHTLSALTLLLLNSTSVLAAVTCENGFVAVKIDATLAVMSSSEGCPLLDNRNSLNMVNRYFPGTKFANTANPNIPTCVSGTSTTETTKKSTIIIGGKSRYEVNVFTESAQRLSENLMYENNDGLVITGNVDPTLGFLAGGGVTFVRVESTKGGNISAYLLLDDSFTTYFTEDAYPLDKEAFTIMGAGGKFQDARGRLQGEGDMYPTQPPGLFSIPDFHVTGEFCAKIR